MNPENIRPASFFDLLLVSFADFRQLQRDQLIYGLRMVGTVNGRTVRLDPTKIYTKNAKGQKPIYEYED